MTWEFFTDDELTLNEIEVYVSNRSPAALTRYYFIAGVRRIRDAQRLVVELIAQSPDLYGGFFVSF
jgi:hypothetical protein